MLQSSIRCYDERWPCIIVARGPIIAESVRFLDSGAGPVCLINFDLISG